MAMKRTIPALAVAAAVALVLAEGALAQHAVFESDRYDVPEDAPFVELRVFLTDPSGAPRPSAPGETLSYRTEGIDATSGLDYEFTADTVEFASGEESKTIRIPLIDDDLAEGVEAFAVHARNSLGGEESTTTVFLEDGEGPSEPDRVASASGGTAGEATSESERPHTDDSARAEPSDLLAQSTDSAGDTHHTDSALEVGSGFELSTGTPAAT